MSVSQNPSGEFEATGITAEEIENDLDAIYDEENIPNYFNEVRIDNLEDGAIAATTLEPDYDIDEITDFDPYEDDWKDLDFENYEVLIKNDEDIYGLTLEDFNTVFIADAQNYAQLDDRSRYLANLHEMMHGSQFNGNWGDDVQQAEGISDEMRDYLNKVADMSYEEFLEGTTEAISEAMIPNGRNIGRPFYQDLTEIAEEELGTNFDLGDEFEHYDDSLLEGDYSIRVSNPITAHIDNLKSKISGAGA